VDSDPLEEFELLDLSRRKFKYPDANELQTRFIAGWRFAGVRLEAKTGKVKAFFFRPIEAYSNRRTSF
jgi:hypothetical protein